MKISKILTGLFLLFSLSSWGQSPKQDTLLRYYSKYPQEALKQAKEMQTKALKTNNRALLVKSLVLKTTYSLQADPNSYPSLLQELETQLKQAKDTITQSLLNSYIAQLYAQYYDNNRYIINERSNLDGFIPESMEEWSSNLFKEKIFSHLEASIKPEKLLEKTPVTDYQEVFLVQVNPSYFPTLYDLLCFRAIGLFPDNNNRKDKTALSGNPAILGDAETFIQIPIPLIPLDADSYILSIWQKLLKFRLQAGQPDIFVLENLKRLENAQEIYNQPNRDSLTLNTLREMLRSYKELPVSVEIMAAEARLLIQNPNPVSVFPPYKRNTENLAGKEQALALCEKGIHLFPQYKRINLLHQIINDLKAPDLSITFPENIYPGENIVLKISSKNLSTITIEIAHIDATAAAYHLQSSLIHTQYPKSKVFRQSYSLKSLLVHQDTTIEIPSPRSGLYEISVEAPGLEREIRNELCVSQLFVSQQNVEEKQNFRVCDWKSGKPVKDALIYIYQYDRPNLRLLDSAYTNAQGLATLKAQGNYYQVINKENPQEKLKYLYSSQYNFYDRYNTEIVTDRKIYRPGQTVYFKGYTWIAGTDTLYAQKNTKFTVDFRAANGKIIGTQTLTSNQFGTFTGSFVIPQDVMNGSFELSTDEDETTIEVADYNRPEFEITFTEPKRSYYIGDTIHVQGKINSFSGVNLANSNIKYQITQTDLFRWRAEAGQKIQGLTVTDANGNFEFSFVATPAVSSFSGFQRPYFYEVNITATDAKGETQEGQISIPVYTGESSPTLRLSREINKNIPTPFYISLDNIAPDATPQKVNYSISKLTVPSKPEYPDVFKDTIIEKTILEGEIRMSQHDSIIPALGSYPSGAYLFTVTCGKNKSKQIFYLYSSKDKKPPIPTYNWLIKEKTACRPGEKARILFGTSEPDSYVLYEIYTPGKLIKRQLTTLSNEIIPIEIPYLSEYGSRIWLIISYVKDKNFIQNVIPIERIYDNRKLAIQTKVFRDRLIPGQKEKWEFCIKNEQGLSAKAEVLAMMYDASLDKIEPYDINFSPGYTYFGFPYLWESRYDNGSGYLFASRYSFNEKKYPLRPLPFNRNYWDIYRYFTEYGSDLGDYGNSYSKAKTAGIMIRGMSRNMEFQGSLDEMVVTGYGASPKTDEKGTPPNVYRKNFQETAFFYPQLITDTAGCVTIRFTVPESTTRWKFVAIANTENLAHGELTKYSVTSKPLMIRPNLPRFLRSGDYTEIRVTVSNLSDSVQAGNATLELFSPLDDRIIIKRNVSFSITAGQSQTLSYPFDVPRQMDVIGCRVLASSGDFSDGEQQLLPILPDEILVTATKPFYTGEKGEHSYTLEQPSTTRKDYRLTLEVAANPIWYAVMALPPLREARSDNATDIVAAFYANAIATTIARSNPQIAKVIQSWETHQDKSQILQSKLEQNQELKSILLSVTPWVLQAQNETERMQTLATLFDENRASYLQEQAMNKLSELQSRDGGWCWFKGMYPSRFITMNVLSAMSKANTTGQREYTEREKRMQIEALRYLDTEIKKDFDKKPKAIGYEQTLYLYVRSMFRDIPLGDALEAHKFFMAEAQKQWQNFSLYEKAVTALTFYRYGFKKDAQNVLRSLREYSKTTAETGMFWPLNRNGYYRNSGVQIQAAIMEAFYEIEGNSKETNLMKQWLLCQKQTQMWENVPSTVDAIHALLLTGKDWLETQAPVTAIIGRHSITTQSGSDPLGYIKTTYTHSEIKPDMLTVKIEKTTDTPTWGSLYLQYFDKIEQIQKQKGTLGIDKKLFIEQTGADGKKELKPIDREGLKIGDKVIVRLTLSLSRDMEFLYLKDLRAACFEPSEQLSGNQWKFGTVYYQEAKDASTNFFFTALRQGTYVIEYPVWVNQAGEYQDGIATFESIYAPEYNAFSGSTKVKVQN